MISKKMLIPMAAVAVIAAGAYGVTKVSAASDPTNPQASLVQKIADTFHLDKSKVQAVFDQNRTEKQARAETNYEARLTQAVTDGKITAAQKDLILAEHNKLKAELDAAAGKTGTDRRTAMDAVRTEGEAWAKANNVDAKWLIGPGHMRGMGGMGMHHGMMGADGDADDGGTSGATTPSPSASPTPSS
jgi:hypothetical protein